MEPIPEGAEVVASTGAASECRLYYNFTSRQYSIWHIDTGVVEPEGMTGDGYPKAPGGARWRWAKGAWNRIKAPATPTEQQPPVENKPNQPQVSIPPSHFGRDRPLVLRNKHNCHDCGVELVRVKHYHELPNGAGDGTRYINCCCDCTQRRGFKCPAKKKPS